MLRPDASVTQAQAELDAAMRQLARDYPVSNATMRGEVLPFWQAPRGPQRMLAGALELLQAIMLTLLLAVCGNTANLVLARASTRHREVGVRIALGAGPRRIFSLLLTENLVLALAGAALGVVLAMWGTQALRAVPMIGSVPIKLVTHVDTTAMVFALLLGLVSGVAFGLAPAVQLGRVDPLHALRSGAKGAGRSGMRHALMGVQIALASLILLVAGMFYRSFSETREADPGFRRGGRAARRVRFLRAQSVRAGQPELRGPAARSTARAARRRGCGDRVVRPARHPRHAAAIVRARGTRAQRRGR